MSTKVAMSLVIDDASPTEIASLLTAISQVERPAARLLVACDNPQQAGQVKRRIREQLGGNGSLEFRQELEQFQGLPYFEVIRPVRELEPEEEEIFDEPAPAVRVADRMPAPARQQRELGEGNFKVRLTEIRKEQQGVKYFVTLGMDVTDGPSRGTHFEDRVVVWPKSDRTEHVAHALGLESETLGQTIDGGRGKEFWVRRRETVRPDGGLRIANYYFPLDTPPPPAWAGFGR